MIFDNSMAIYSRQIFPTSNHKLQLQYTSFSKVNIGNVILGENIGNESQSYELFVASDFQFQMSNSERASLVVYDEFGSIVGTVQFSLLDVLHDEIDWFTGDVGPWSDYFSFDYSDLYLTAFDDSSGLRYFVIESASSSQNGENKIRYTHAKCQISVLSDSAMLYFPIYSARLQTGMFMFRAKLCDFARINSKFWIVSQTATQSKNNARQSQSLHQSHLTYARNTP